MGQRVLSTAATGAITDGSQSPLPVTSDLFDGGNVMLGVDGLAGVETVTLWILINDSWKPFNDSSGSQITLAVDSEVVELTSPAVYGYTKDATSAALSFTVEDPRA